MLIPHLREDLRLIPVKRDDGKTWYIFDPLRNKYHSVNRDTLLILKRWKGGEPLNQFIARLKSNEIDLSLQDLLDFIIFLKKNKLIKTRSHEDVKALSDEASQVGIKKLSRFYIFYRLHLVNPDNWLYKNLGFARHLTSKYVRYPIYAAFIFGLINFFNGNINYSDNTNYLFSFEGLTSLIISIVFLKICHELAHAFTIKNYDGRVPSMGISFIFLFPLLFTDANASWELGKRQRLFVGSAGMLTELHIGMLAFFVWSINDPGVINNIGFAVFVASFVSSILINATPFLKFDGYFLLCDWLNFDNLHDRSFSVAKTKIKNFILSTNLPIKDNVSRSTQRHLFWFAIATWFYRLFIFTAIAGAVYAFFPFKIIGLIAAITIIFLLLGLPIFKELIEYFEHIVGLNGLQHRAKSSYKLTLILVVFLAVIFAPFKTNYQAYGVITSQEYRSLYPQNPSVVSETLFKDNLSVTKNQSILKLSSPEDQYEFIKFSDQEQIIENKLKILRINQTNLEEVNLLESRLAGIKRNLSTIYERVSRNEISSPINGRLVNTHYLPRNAWVPAEQLLVTVVNTKKLQVIAFIQEKEIHHLQDATSLIFVSNDLHLKPIKVTLRTFDSVPTEDLNDYPQLASLNGGRLASYKDADTNGALKPTSPLIKAYFDLSNEIDQSVEMETKGVVHIKANSRVSLFSLFSKALYSRVQGLI